MPPHEPFLAAPSLLAHSLVLRARSQAASVTPPPGLVDIKARSLFKKKGDESDDATGVSGGSPLSHMSQMDRTGQRTPESMLSGIPLTNPHDLHQFSHTQSLTSTPRTLGSPYLRNSPLLESPLPHSDAEAAAVLVKKVTANQQAIAAIEAAQRRLQRAKQELIHSRQLWSPEGSTASVDGASPAFVGGAPTNTTSTTLSPPEQSTTTTTCVSTTSVSTTSSVTPRSPPQPTLQNTATSPHQPFYPATTALVMPATGGVNPMELQMREAQRARRQELLQLRELQMLQ
eukprot:TRINITY_DN60743_c0_g1_i2.p1 TRINITY_DN60743_c0_g1~~TRINITY_DN60743_c0_g1_i2.p1  ORF type:complete len:287 (-),score=26.17 TRINITY_DN60743_c0_g1_i2:121-981(-)